MSRRLFLAPNHEVREPLPVMRSHQEWCRWLKMCNSLAIDHRRCLFSETCMAGRHKATVVEWRSVTRA